MTQSKHSVITIDNAQLFVFNCMTAVGTPPELATTIADVLVFADHCGRTGYGLNTLHKMVEDILRGRCDPTAEPSKLYENNWIAWLTGNNGLGPVVSLYGMKLALKKAKEFGVGFVSIKDSNNAGPLSFYTSYAYKKGFIGLAFTNSSSRMCPTRGKKAVLGSNPLSIGAPGLEGDRFVFDMACSTVAFGQVEICRRKRIPFPRGWVINEDCLVETDSSVSPTKLMLLPLGGREDSSGYKGTSLSIMVDILTGALSGSCYGQHLAPWETDHKTSFRNLGHCFIVINPEFFCPGFGHRMSDFLMTLRRNDPIDNDLPVLVPGDFMKARKEKVYAEGGIRYSQNLVNLCQTLANKLNIAPIIIKT